MKKLSFLFFLICTNISNAQNFAINTDGSAANASAALDVKSSNKGVLIPRVTKAQRNAIPSPAKGLLVFVDDTDSTGFYFYNSTKWVWLLGDNVTDTFAWKRTGNSGTNANNHFIGTRDAQPISFRQNNQWLGRWNATTDNYMIGDVSGNNDVGFRNIGIGSLALSTNTANDNTAIGHSALRTNTSGFNNTAIGAYAMDANAARDGNTAVGTSALRFNIANYNTAVGIAALANNEQDGNVAVGDSALYANGFGYGNTAVGSRALFSNTDGVGNTALGHGALTSNTTGISNVAVGATSLTEVTTGTGNVAVGHQTGRVITTGSNNTILGSHAYAAFNQTGSGNVAVGRGAFQFNRSGSYNIAIGFGAGINSDTGSNNTLIGLNTHFESNALRSTALGHLAQVDSSDQIVLGSVNGINNATTTARVGIGLTNPQRRLHVRNTGASGATAISSATAVFEDDGNHYLQLLSPLGNESGILFGRPGSTIRSGLIFDNSSSLRFRTGGNSTRMLLDSLGNLGIGTTTPDRRLHVVKSGSSGATAVASATAIFEDDDNHYLQLLSPMGKVSGILFGRPGGSSRSGITFDNSSSILFAAGGNVDRVIVDSLGNVGIGDLTPSVKLSVDGGIAWAPSSITISGAFNTVTVGNRSFLRITNSSATGFKNLSITDGSTAGQILVIQAITGGSEIFFQGTCTRLNGGSLIMDNNDTITLIWDGSCWNEIAHSNNN